MEERLGEKWWGHISDPRLMMEGERLPKRVYDAYRGVRDNMRVGREGLVYKQQLILMKHRFYVPNTLVEATSICAKFHQYRKADYGVRY